LLKTLATLTPKDGEAGTLAEADLSRDNMGELLSVNSFREGLRKAISRQDIWPIILVVAACIFFADIFIRRVTVHFYWVGPAIKWTWDRLLRREQEEVSDERMQRLRSSKSAITEEFDERRAAARFAPEVDDDAPEFDLDEVIGEAGGAARQAPPRARPESTKPDADEESGSYTSRLLDAKKKAWKDKE
jgi:hypothetical protein